MNLDFWPNQIHRYTFEACYFIQIFTLGFFTYWHIPRESMQQRVSGISGNEKWFRIKESFDWTDDDQIICVLMIFRVIFKQASTKMQMRRSTDRVANSSLTWVLSKKLTECLNQSHARYDLIIVPTSHLQTWAT